jgi:hypothetical protein
MTGKAVNHQNKGKQTTHELSPLSRKTSNRVNAAALHNITNTEPKHAMKGRFIVMVQSAIKAGTTNTYKN